LAGAEEEEVVVVVVVMRVGQKDGRLAE